MDRTTTATYRLLLSGPAERQERGGREEATRRRRKRNRFAFKPTHWNGGVLLLERLYLFHVHASMCCETDTVPRLPLCGEPARRAEVALVRIGLLSPSLSLSSSLGSARPEERAAGRRAPQAPPVIVPPVASSRLARSEAMLVGLRLFVAETSQMRPYATSLVVAARNGAKVKIGEFQRAKIKCYVWCASSARIIILLLLLLSSWWMLRCLLASVISFVSICMQ